MRGAMQFAAGLFAGLAIQVGIAQNANSGVVMMNHVGISVPNIAEAVSYYTQKMGYREAFRITDAHGQPKLVYMQISKNTFLESQPCDRSAACRFFSLWAPSRERRTGRLQVQEEWCNGQ